METDFSPPKHELDPAYYLRRSQLYSRLGLAIVISSFFVNTILFAIFQTGVWGIMSMFMAVLGFLLVIWFEVSVEKPAKFHWLFRGKFVVVRTDPYFEATTMEDFNRVESEIDQWIANRPGKGRVWKMNKLVYKFENPRHATLFKLTWG
jgi:hypothetical protein